MLQTYYGYSINSSDGYYVQNISTAITNHNKLDIITQLVERQGDVSHGQFTHFNRISAPSMSD